MWGPLNLGARLQDLAVARRGGCGMGERET